MDVLRAWWFPAVQIEPLQSLVALICAGYNLFIGDMAWKIHENIYFDWGLFCIRLTMTVSFEPLTSSLNSIVVFVST